LYPRFEFDASGTLLVPGQTIRIDPQNQPGEGTAINAEDVLGVSTTSFQSRAALRWGPGRRHELELGFLRAVRSARKVLVDTLTFSDTAFAAGLRINSNLRTSQAFLTYRFAFRVRPESQIGAGRPPLLQRGFRCGLGYTLGFYTVELEKGTTGERFLDIDVAGKIKYTVNGFRGGAVFQF
jgi:hypothetical protein